MQEFVMIMTLLSIWSSLLMASLTLAGAVHFWLTHSKKVVDIEPLEHYPSVTIIVPAHNEEVVIAQTTRAILDLNYPAEKVELLIYADNCGDQTARRAQAVLQMIKYKHRNARVIERHGQGGKAGVLNDALKVAKGEYIAVYDADAMPEKNALYFLVRKGLENPLKYVAVFGRNKTRNAKQNFLTRCINQEIVVIQRIQHCAIWHLFKIGRIPGTNFIIKREYVKSIGGWENGALTEDTDISFKIMQSGKLIALAYNSEAFQQEPEQLRDYYFQRLRWAKGNYQVVLKNFRHLFDRSNWRVKLETFYYSCTFFWFNAAIVLSDIIFITNIIFWFIHLFKPHVLIPFTFGESNILIAQLLLFNWLLMIILYVLQITTASATQFGQATNKQIWLALASYFTYSQLFIIVSINAVISVGIDKLMHRDGTKWVKTKRFAD
ncbi:glycosyl transferase [Limosilactobacillus reuteri]|jgi:Glycosyltransferases, probably involved in cell wall biogenesis|uniref:Glycosyl transferase n=1 Tax=Limosilactobacillus reuteri TaxID=1598 RepID=A0A256SN27_LIMRT|nr:glycosyltransferase [Limosilactobacillus reuteri]MCR1863559.1 glycosyltransferase [Limosilactobacillus reuteri]MCR1893236.1 glycosyltransferase [Limosilactobacillus reuteri]MRH31189.1 glycosyltransferase [Limosilactobacillus reuteri]OYS45792.1 glycosyl transferase [Limosilactobacillus reuteri]OYS50631.1 glycosyl transferase [Limosilactobacillus reuteri]